MEWLNSTPNFWQAALFIIILFAVLQLGAYLLRPLWEKKELTQAQAEEALRAELDELKKNNADLERRLEASEKSNEEHAANQKMLLSELGRANAKIARQEQKIADLSEKVKDLEKTNPITPVDTVPFEGRVLGVWPVPLQLDVAAEKDAIENTGLPYDALEAENATRRNIVDMLGQHEYRIVEIGAKGGPQGILLHDGMTPPSWWARLAKQHNVEIFVVLANDSSAVGGKSVADALFAAGAKAVVGVDGRLTDLDAINFVHMFYQRLSRGIKLEKAVEYAKLVITDPGSDTITLRVQ